MGAEGSAIKLLGVVSIMVTLAGISVSGDFLVAKVLNTEAILELDFLEQNCCTINAQHRFYIFKEEQFHYREREEVLYKRPAA